MIITCISMHCFVSGQSHDVMNVGIQSRTYCRHIFVHIVFQLVAQKKIVFQLLNIYSRIRNIYKIQISFKFLEILNFLANDVSSFHPLDRLFFLHIMCELLGNGHHWETDTTTAKVFVYCLFDALARKPIRTYAFLASKNN